MIIQKQIKILEMDKFKIINNHIQIAQINKYTIIEIINKMK